MLGKTCIITGATSGIGQAAAFALAGKGARIVIVARDRRRADVTLDKLRAINPNAAHRAYLADLSGISEMKRAAAEISASEPRIDVLINNAGALFSYRKTTADGFERTFALNHLAYFVLTHGLIERVRASAPARIVNTSSGIHKRARLDLDDLQCSRGYDGVTAYERSKLCNVLFTRELARRLTGTGVTANSFHPGLVASRFGNRSNGLFTPLFFVIKTVFGLSAEAGARTLVYLASSPEVGSVSGKYFENCTEVLPGRWAEDDEAAARLWRESAGMTDIDW